MTSNTEVGVRYARNSSLTFILEAFMFFAEDSDDAIIAGSPSSGSDVVQSYKVTTFPSFPALHSPLLPLSKLLTAGQANLVESLHLLITQILLCFFRRIFDNDIDTTAFTFATQNLLSFIRIRSVSRQRHNRTNRCIAVDSAVGGAGIGLRLIGRGIECDRRGAGSTAVGQSFGRGGVFILSLAVSVSATIFQY